MNARCLLSITLCVASTTPVLNAANAQRPDVLFIFVDDMTYNGLNELGTSEIISPNLDKLVRSGVRFDNCYNMGGWSGAISTASRSQLMSGLYLWNTHHALNGDKYNSLFQAKAIWPQVMKKAGYKTFHTGKWHMYHINADMVYDKAIAVRPGMPKTVESAYNRPLSKNDKGWLPWDMRNGGYWENGRHWSEILADHTIHFIKDNKDSKSPLFICCAFNAPHDPRQSPKEYIDMYDVDNIKVPVSFLPEYPYKEEMGSGKKLRDERLAPFPRTRLSVQQHRLEYYALITHLDTQVGRILKTLRESGREKNTLIIFAADNGLALGCHGLIGKQSMYDHSMKIPLVFSGLDLPHNEHRKQLVYLQDLVPTLYDLLGIDQPETMQFVSQKNVLLKNGRGKRKSVYGAYLDKQRMVRMGNYKLFFIPEAKKVMLFNLKDDPYEMHDLYGHGKQYDKIVKKLVKEYQTLSAEAGDQFDLKEYFPQLF